MPTYTLPDLPYDYAALKPAMAGEILELHHDKHHATYVKGANDTLEQLAEIADKATPTQTVGLEKTLAFNLSGQSCTRSSGTTSARTAAIDPTATWARPSTSTSAPSTPSPRD